MLMLLAYLRRYQDVYVGFFSKPKKERDVHVVRYLIWLLVVCSQINYKFYVKGKKYYQNYHIYKISKPLKTLN